MAKNNPFSKIIFQRIEELGILDLNIEDSMIKQTEDFFIANMKEEKPPETLIIFHIYLFKKIKQNGFKIDSLDLSKFIAEKWELLPQERKETFENIKQNLQRSLHKNPVGATSQKSNQSFVERPKHSTSLIIYDDPMEGVEATKRTCFEIFLPLIKDFLKYADKVLKCYENAEYNRRVCGVLLERVYSVADGVKVLHLNSNYSWFFENSGNYPIFQGFVKMIEKIQNFVMDISQLQGVGKYFNEYRGPEFSMERIFYSLIGEFEKTTEALTHALKGHLHFGRPKAGQNIEDEAAINMDIRDMEKYIRIIAGGIADGQNILEGVGTIATLNKTFQRKEHIVLFDEVLNEAVLQIQNFQYTG
ncbi:5329_t:CDS:2, partial [Ambispora gerdemannii]